MAPVSCYLFPKNESCPEETVVLVIYQVKEAMIVALEVMEEDAQECFQQWYSYWQKCVAKVHLFDVHMSRKGRLCSSNHDDMG
jgi:hypothetical protein